MTQNPNGNEGFRNTKACLKISCGSFIQKSDADVVGIQRHYSYLLALDTQNQIMNGSTRQRH